MDITEEEQQVIEILREWDVLGSNYRLQIEIVEGVWTVAFVQLATHRVVRGTGATFADAWDRMDLAPFLGLRLIPEHQTRVENKEATTMNVKRYAIRCTPGGLLTEESTGDVIYFGSYVEAETGAQRLMGAASSNPRIAGMEMDFTPEEVPDDRN